MAQSNHVNRNQTQDIDICGLSQFGPSLGKCILDDFPFVAAKNHNFDSRQIDFKADKVKNSCSLSKTIVGLPSI